MAGSSAAATRMTAESIASICARRRARCSPSSPAFAPNSLQPRWKASAPPMRTVCSPNSNPSRKTSAMPSKPRPANLPEKSSAMADPVLKLAPEQRDNPASAPAKTDQPRGLVAGLRRYRRFLLLVVLPLVVLVGGVVFYLNGGRYVSTD